MDKTLSELFQEAHADAVAALDGQFFPVPPLETICVLYNQKIGRLWGCAKPWYCDPYTTMIKLSETLCRHTNPNAILNTMIHEIIHCCGVWNHKHNFKLAARLINAKFPGKYHVSRCTGAQEKMTDEQMDEAYKYIVECPNCHHKWGFKRMIHAVRNPERCWCPHCKKTEKKKIPLIRAK